MKHCDNSLHVGLTTRKYTAGVYRHVSITTCF